MQQVLSQIPWSLLLILLPLAAGMIAFLLPRLAIPLGLMTTAMLILAVAGLGWHLHAIPGGIYQHAVGGWGAPLGIDLYADGLSLLMLTVTALVSMGVSIYAAAYFEREQALRFWPIWLFLLAAMNALFLGPGGR